MSRVQSKDRGILAGSRPQTGDQPSGLAVPGGLVVPSGLVVPHVNGISKTITAHDHRPFTEAELVLAMKRSQLALSTQG